MWDTQTRTSLLDHTPVKVGLHDAGKRTQHRSTTVHSSYYSAVLRTTPCTPVQHGRDVHVDASTLVAVVEANLNLPSMHSYTVSLLHTIPSSKPKSMYMSHLLHGRALGRHLQAIKQVAPLPSPFRRRLLTGWLTRLLDRATCMWGCGMAATEAGKGVLLREETNGNQ